jgi:hypothetical protein
MKMTLRKKQAIFTELVAKLILKAYEDGYEMSIAYATRSPEENERIGGSPRSLHLHRLAVDLNLFRNARWLSSTEAHRPLGEWWEEQHEMCRWGGHWSDGNHYSFSHGGRS